MGLAVAIIFTGLCFLGVMLAASALENTGLNREQARTQSLAAFFGTGTGNLPELPQRRKILQSLVISGRIGFIILLAAVVLAIRDVSLLRSVVNLLIIAGAFYFLYWLIGIRGVTLRLPGDILPEKQTVETGEPADPVEEVYQQSEGYGLAVIRIDEDSKLAGLPLSEISQREKSVSVLSIQRKGKLLPFPKSWYKLQVGDKIACYGNLEAIRQLS